MKTKTIASVVIILCLFGHIPTVDAFTLQETVKHVLNTNPEVRAAVNEFESRRFEVKQARSGYLPSVSIDLGVGQEIRKAPSTGDVSTEFNRREVGLSASQIIFDGFATSSEVQRQNARVDSAKYSLISISEDLSLQTSKAYLDVLRYSALLKLTQSSLWEHQNIFDQMKLRSDKGVGSKADLDQISARLALANSNMIVAQNNFADTQVSYHRITGLHPSVDTMIRPVISYPLPETREKAIDIALQNHPTLASASADVKAAHAQYKATASAFWPKITLEADKRWDENVGIAGSDEDLTVALRLRYDLYRGGANKAKRKQTAYLMDESKDVRDNSRRQVIESMNLSWNSYMALTQQEVFLQSHVKAAEATKLAYGKQFNIGRRTLLDLLNTETEVVESRRSLINAEFDHLYSAYRIFNAAGKLTSVLK